MSYSSIQIYTLKDLLGIFLLLLLIIKSIDKLSTNLNLAICVGVTFVFRVLNHITVKT